MTTPLNEMIRNSIHLRRRSSNGVATYGFAGAVEGAVSEVEGAVLEGAVLEVEGEVLELEGALAGA